MEHEFGHLKGLGHVPQVDPVMAAIGARSADCEQALDIFMATRFSSGLSMPDAVIGATAMGLSATLFTFNARDFKSIKGLDFKAPYAR